MGTWLSPGIVETELMAFVSGENTFDINVSDSVGVSTEGEILGNIFRSPLYIISSDSKR